ncbi:molecular chaperone DnaJ [bacterium]|nr:molecular chaperone DnaJ [bacterium]
MPRDYYEVLGVDRSADSITIKKSYRKLAMKFHPDQNPGDREAEEKFKEAAQAYEVLSNDEKRAKYDQYGHAAFQGGRGGGGAGFHDMSDIFEQFGDIFGDFFGGGGGTSRSRGRSTGPRRGSDLRYVLEIKLEDVVEGDKKPIEFRCEDNCESCNGSGAKKDSGVKTCGTCGGRGQVIRQQGFFSMATTCPTCSGQGQVIEDPCDECHGQGRVEKKRKILVNVPAGVDTGTQLRLSGEGEGGYRGGPAGDLFVELRVKPHKQFEREGPNLFSQIEVPYLKALLGGPLEVKTIRGKTKIEIPPGTQPYDEIRVVKEGLPSLRGSRVGDLLLRAKVVFPKKLKKEEEKLLRKIAESTGEEVSESKSGLFGF